MPMPNPHHYKPANDWLAQQDDISLRDILLGERLGLRLPTWVPDAQHVFVDEARVPDWRALLKLTIEALALAPNEQCPKDVI